MGKITLDADTFKALASSTRLTVLKALDERRKTLTELSRDLDLNKATVHEHMALLTAAGLVRKRDDEGRKWIYYELTWTGQRILHPEATTTFNLLLGLSVAAAGGGIAMLGRALGWWLDGPSAEGSDVGLKSAPETSADGDSAPAASPEGGAADDQQLAFSSPAPEESAGDSGPVFFDDDGWIAIALMLTCALFLVLAWFMQRKLLPKPLDPDSAASAESGMGLP